MEVGQSRRWFQKQEPKGKWVSIKEKVGLELFTLGRKELETWDCEPKLARFKF